MSDPPPPAPGRWPLSPGSYVLTTLALLAGHHTDHRIRRCRRSQAPIKSYPLAVAFSFITFAVILVILGRLTRLPRDQLLWAALPGALVAAVGYLAQAVWQRRATQPDTALPRQPSRLARRGGFGFLTGSGK